MERLKVAFIDDELLVKVGMRSLIDWEKQGFEVVGDAANEEEALKLIEETHPDIVFVDIMLSSTSGLELIRKLREKYGDKINIVILTAYSNFSYAQKAIEFGVDEYLLKLELNEAVLADCLNKIRSKNSKYPTKDDKHHEIDVDLDTGMLLYEIYKNNFSVARLKEELIKANIIIKGNYSIIALLINEYYYKVDKKLIKNKGKFASSFKNLVNNIASSFNFNSFNMLFENVYLAVNQGSYNHSVYKEFYDELNRVVLNYMNVNIIMGISDDCSQYELLPQMMRNAVSAAMRGSISDHGQIVKYNNIVVDKNYISENLSHQVKEIYKGFIDGDKNKIITTINNIFSNCRDWWLSPEDIQNCLNELLVSFYKVIKAFGGSLGEIGEKSHMIPFWKIERIETIDNICAMINEYAVNLYEYINDLRGKNNPIKILQGYIEENYTENISLEKAAKIVSMSKSYLSTIFKKVTGINFNEYVMTVKMDKAYELLKTGDLTIYEVAEKIGFNNPNYFSKVFKKYKGISPSETKSKNNC